MLELTKGWHQARVREIVEEALQQIVEPIIFAEALELIAHHRDAGHEVVIVSASPEEIVEPLARYVGAHRAIASRARVDDEGRYSGEMEYDAFGPAKADAMRAIAAQLDIDLERSWAYSDSATDLPMLETVGHPVAVNPDRDLLKAANDRGWEVRRFVRPVRLRTRVSPRRAAWAALGGAVAAAAGGVVWWRLNRRRLADELRDETALTAAHTLAHTVARRIHAPARLGSAERAAVPVYDGRALAQSTRSFLAAMTPSATTMARRMSFFMPSRVSASR
jgi:HAD superfamily hydrolase (TIGR01490 family)